MATNYKNIPKWLKDSHSWVVAGATKIPYDPKTGGKASCDDWRTWGKFAEAVAYLRENPDCIGVGVELHDLKVVVIDLDDCIVDGKLTEEAKRIVERINSYTEISYSGTGLHIFCFGDIPDSGRRDNKKGIEIYKDNRYILMTGNVYEDYRILDNRSCEIMEFFTEYFPDKKKSTESTIQSCNSSILSDEELMIKACNAKNGQLFSDLYIGDWLKYYKSQSEADQAFCNMLAFWTNCDCEQMNRIVQNSKLYREKWDEKHGATTYGERTIQTATRDCKEVYKPKVPQEVNDNQKQVSSSHEPTIIRLDSIDSQDVKWLWFPYIPSGKITLMLADPGTGKTWLSLKLASIVSNGGKFYGEKQDVEHQARTVIYQTAEDGLADTIKPRLEKMKPYPDFANIYIINEEKQGLTLSDERIENAMKEVRPALLIIDPLQAYIGADVNMNMANAVRPILANIGRLAEKYDCSILFIMHMSKKGDVSAMYRALGTIDIPAVARSMLIVGKNPDDKNQRIICHDKSSLAMHGESVIFHIDPMNGGVVFDGFSNLTADEVINAKTGERNKPSVRLEEVKDSLIELLGDDGYVSLQDVETLQNVNGWGKSTLYTAKKELGIQSVSIGFSEKKVTWWLAYDVDKNKFKMHPPEIPNKTQEQLNIENGTWPP